ncbi:MAG: cysteine dioxygenase family protein [Phycisphaerales bacterium]|jgi:predicted metal-dependent enzyme (double-stranded beta helix superfamily)|nr:cysteine dioxygenase family protein [Phycisphaerales bacterium]
MQTPTSSVPILRAIHDLCLRMLPADHGGDPGGAMRELCSRLRLLDLTEIVEHTRKQGANSVAAQRKSTDYARFEIRSDARASLVLICWLPGHFSLPHDHGGSTCIVGVIEGVASEHRYEIDGREHAHLVESDRFSPGSITRCDGSDVHALGNDARNHDPLLTLHLYEPSPTMRTYHVAPARSQDDAIRSVLRENPHAFFI